MATSCSHYFRETLRGAERLGGSVEDLRGLRIALGSEVFYEGAVRRLFGDSVVGFSSQQAMFGALAEGSVDVVLAALPNGMHWVRELGLTDVRVAGEFSMPGVEGEDLRFGVRPALEPLARIMDDALAAISPTEQRTIENRWLGASAVRGEVMQRRLSFSAAEEAYLAQRGGRLQVCVSPAWMPIEGLDRHGRHAGIALESQLWPDAPNHADYPSARLEAGQLYRQTTVMSFHRSPKG